MKRCCFIGHREIKNEDMLKYQILAFATKMITEYGVETFIFGSKSCFDDLAWRIVYDLKKEFSHIKLVKFCCEFEDEFSEVKSFDYFYLPKTVIGAKNLSYVERNKAMIDMSDIIIFITIKKVLIIEVVLK